MPGELRVQQVAIKSLGRKEVREELWVKEAGLESSHGALPDSTLNKLWGC